MLLHLGAAGKKKKTDFVIFCYGICVCVRVCVCVCVCARVVSEQLQSVTIGVCPLVHPQLSLVEPRHQVLMLPLFKVWLTPFKKWGHSTLLHMSGFWGSQHSSPSGWDSIIDTSNWLPNSSPCFFFFFPFSPCSLLLHIGIFFFSVTLTLAVFPVVLASFDDYIFLEQNFENGSSG